MPTKQWRPYQGLVVPQVAWNEQKLHCLVKSTKLDNGPVSGHPSAAPGSRRKPAVRVPASLLWHLTLEMLLTRHQTDTTYKQLAFILHLCN